MAEPIKSKQAGYLAIIDTPNSISVTLAEPILLQDVHIYLASGMPIERIDSHEPVGEATQRLTLWFSSPLDLTQPIDIVCEAHWVIRARMGAVVRSEHFDHQFAYDGPLGALYEPAATTFVVWSPVAERIQLVTYHDDIPRYTEMTREARGVFRVQVAGDLFGIEYVYAVTIDGETALVVDPYTQSATLNGQRGVVVSITPTSEPRPVAAQRTLPIIYEAHVRDMSIFHDSGVTHKGQFLGLAEENTTTSTGQITGLDYICSLGVSHVQLLPIYDYSSQSVDEANPLATYNWGYDPLHYNTPEGSYSTNPRDSLARIRELQTMVDAIHRRGLGVIMDVVYNHVYHINEHSFNQLVPGYYFRYHDDGTLTNQTGVGNDIASERLMARKFIVDSITFWAKTYQLDGFRFDLMGMLDVETMQAVRRALDQIDPTLFILGEGWNMGTLPEWQRATQQNAAQLQGIAFFNDSLRDAVKGSTYGMISRGFASGELYKEGIVLQSLRGGEGLHSYTSPRQVVQYIEAHDNYTVWDQMAITNGMEDEHTRVKRHLLATSIALLAQGVPFIHAGQEFLRTKQGDENSYRSPDEINQMDWHRAEQFGDAVQFVRELIKIRKQERLFQMATYLEIHEQWHPVYAGEQVVSYSLGRMEQPTIVVAHNANLTPRGIGVANGTYDILVNGQSADADGLAQITVTENYVIVDALSTLVIRRIPDKKEGWVKEGDIWRHYPITVSE